MNSFATFIALVSTCYVVYAGNDWREGKTQCELCVHETKSILTNQKMVRNQAIPKLTEACAKYPTPDGSCSSLLDVFKVTYDTLESRLDAEALCTYYGVCASGKTIDTSDPTIPAAPVSPKDPSKVYTDATCRQCNVTASVAYLNVGAYAQQLNSGVENNCLSWTKKGSFATAAETQRCKGFVGQAYDKLTQTIEDKSNVDYLCKDLFDMCPSN